MSQHRTTSGVTYAAAQEGYFEQRGLTRSARFWGLWGIAVAAVVSGDFSGWNFGIASAGWGGFVIAALVVTAMYFAMLFSIGETSAAMPHTGGAHPFARAAMGPCGAGSSPAWPRPCGIGPVVLATPFAMWLFLGIEELPLAAEEAHTPSRDIPRAGIWGLVTLVVSGGVVIVLDPAVTGAAALGGFDGPPLDSFRAILPGGALAAVLSALALAVFALFGRHYLVLSPEEGYAMTGGLSSAPTEEEPARRGDGAQSPTDQR